MASSPDVEEVLRDLDKMQIDADMPMEQGSAFASLKKLHARHVVLERQLRAERLALERKYNALKAPVYAERAMVLSTGAPQDHGTVLEGFWLKAMKNQKQLRSIVEEVDEPVLCYLQNITAAAYNPVDETKGFSLIFSFAPNPYFEPLELVKSYLTEESEDGDASLLCTEATKVEWKPGKDITKKTVTRKQKNKRTKQIRKLTETVSVPSFFTFFMSQGIPTEEEMAAMTEEKVEELEVLVEADYENGCIFRQKLIPNALMWYTGEAVNSDGEDDSDDEDEESDDDEIDEVDPDDDADDMGRKHKTPRARKKPTEPPNCKQQ